MKKGFTLIELLIVITLVAIIGVGVSLSFTKVESDTAKEDLKNKYIEIQRAASMYLDLNNSELEWFIENKEIDIKLSELSNGNYITSDLVNPVTHDEISQSYYVRLCIELDDKNQEFVKTSIIDKTSEISFNCISNQYGESNNCGCKQSY